MSEANRKAAGQAVLAQERAQRAKIARPTINSDKTVSGNRARALLLGVALTSAALTGLACGDATETTPVDGGADTGAPLSGYAPCSAATKVGGFTVTLAAAFTGVDGQVLDGVVPQNVPRELQTAGSCRLLGAPSLACSPPCAPGETCSESGACITYPQSHSVGTVTLTGLEVPVAMSPQYGNIYTNPAQLPHPGFIEGADIRLTATGGDYAPFTLSGQGIRPMEVADASKAVLVESGKSVDLSWKAPGLAGLARVHIELNINNHGTTAAWIACEAEDTGSFSIPAELVTALYDLGLSGGPTVVVTRRSADSTTIAAGCVQLLVSSELALEVEVPGLTSCTVDTDCPSGETCQTDLTCK